MALGIARGAPHAWPAVARVRLDSPCAGEHRADLGTGSDRRVVRRVAVGSAVLCRIAAAKLLRSLVVLVAPQDSEHIFGGAIPAKTTAAAPRPPSRARSRLTAEAIVDGQRHAMLCCRDFSERWCRGTEGAATREDAARGRMYLEKMTRGSSMRRQPEKGTHDALYNRSARIRCAVCRSAKGPRAEGDEPAARARDANAPRKARARPSAHKGPSLQAFDAAPVAGGADFGVGGAAIRGAAAVGQRRACSLSPVDQDRCCRAARAR